MKKEKSATTLPVGDNIAAQAPSANDGAFLSAEQLTGFITDLRRVIDALNQVGSIFTLLQYVAEGDNRISHERRLTAVIGALNEVGTLGDSLISQAFGAADVLHALGRHQVGIADAGKAVQ